MIERIGAGFCAAAFATLFCVAGAAAQTGPDLTKPPGAEWPSIGGDWYNTHYSTLKQITVDNVKQLKGAWAIHLGSGLGPTYGLEGTPIVQDGVMYMTTGADDVLALDAKTGALIWESFGGLDPNISTVCCGWVNHGVAVGDGKVFIGRLDGFLAALDQKTGKELWRTQIGSWQDGYTITSAPLYYNGVVYTGIAGGERAIRGKLTALDAKTGKELWHFLTVPDPGQKGSETWPSPNDPNPARAKAYLQGGGTIWQTPAVDPELGLIYFSTGNPGPGIVGVGINRPGDNLFTSSIMALHLDGTYAWHFQAVHHDLWDFDLASPVVLFDAVYNGQPRKVIAEAAKTGWVYLLDRTNGQPLVGIEEKAVEQSARVATAATQPYPKGDALMPQCPDQVPGWQVTCIFGTIGDKPILLQPLIAGGVVWANMAYSPDTGYLYATANARPYGRVWASSPNTAPPPIGAKYSGTFTALDPHTNKIVWQNKTTYPIGQGSGVLATAGGLLFHAEPDGNLQALDAKSGELLWHWQTGSGAEGPVISYEIDGVQYVAIASGGLVSNHLHSANGDLLWAFSLQGSPGNRLGEFPPPPPPATSEEFDNRPGGRPDEFPIQNTKAIRIIDYTYAPLRASVSAGTEVTFTNNGREPYNAKGDGWDTGLISPGHSATVRFDKPGTYTYQCTPELSMLGQVIVTGTAVPDAKAAAVVTKAGD
jgi:alcohol dehydrogenase (cytochrome c)